ncbi:flippase [Pediococcus sp. M21F004]|uniref:flippase n=1 Tax=Pediococcus sp. M21F004 TaxID=3390033 RepID=UPI003DA748C1
MKVLKNYLWNSSYQLFVLIVPFVTIPYVSRVLGPSGIGVNAYTNSIIQFFILFGSLGFSLYGNRETAYHRSDKYEYSKIFWEVLFLRAIAVLFVSFIFFIFLFFYSDYRQALVMQYFALLSVAFDITWFFMGMEDFKVTVIRNIFVKLISVLAIFTFIRDSKDLVLYIFILSFSTLLGNLTMFPYLRKYLVSVPLNKLRLFRHLRPTLILFVPQISINIYIILNKTMLGKMDSVTAAGYFDNADKLIKVLLMVITATGSVMLPHIANAYANHEFKKIKSSLYFFFSFDSILAIPMMFGVIAISRSFAVWFFGKDFSMVGNIMQIEALVIPIMAWSNVVGAQYLLPQNRNKEYTIAVTIGAVLNLILNIPLILVWGASGAAVATVISEAGVTSYELYTISGEIKIKSLFHEIWKFIFAGAVMCFTVLFLNRNISFGIGTLLFDALTGVLIYGSCLLVLRPTFLMNLITKVVTKYKRK